MANRRERRAAAKQGDATTICASAVALKAQGRLQEAVKRYRLALSIDPGSPDRPQQSRQCIELARPHR